MTKNIYGENIFITGVSSGIGRASAEAFLKAGCKVTGVSRHVRETFKKYANGAELTTRKMDVTDEASVRRVIGSLAGVDVAVLSAGYGIAGSIEDVPLEQARKQMEVNYLGVLSCVRALLPKMRRQGKGLIVIVGSVAGRISIPMQSHYSASKYALEALAESLRLETEAFGIRTVILEPGDTRTGFTDHRETLIPEDSVYRDAARQAIGRMEEDERHGTKAKKVAGAILRLCGKKEPPVRLAVGARYKVAVRLFPVFSDRSKEKCIRKIYMKQSGDSERSIKKRGSRG